MTIITARSSHRFAVRHLSVTPELLGAKHEFIHSENHVELRLPALEQNEDGTLRKQRVHCWSWQTVDGKEIPTAYHVSSVDLFLDVERELDIPDQALHVQPRSRELFSKEQQLGLDCLSQNQDSLAKNALRHWLHTIRWRTGMGYIGQPEIEDDRRWPINLICTQSNCTFWGVSTAVTLFGSGNHFVTAAQWHETQLVFSAGITAPPWFNFIFEAEQRLTNKDDVTAILCAAIGFELIMRNLLFLHISNESAKHQIVATILDQANLRSIVNHRKRMTVWNDDWEKQFDNSAFNALMNCRDAIMHRADVSTLTKPNWRKIFQKLLEFAYFVDERLHCPNVGTE